MELGRAWEHEADRWVAWAREPGHDSYWRFHRRQFLGLVPPPGRLTVDVGCGEGRVARDLQQLGHRVVGFDLARVMVAAAVAHHEPIVAAQADAARLPVRSGAADVVVAFMSLQDVDEPEAALMEIGRVLAPGGRLHLAVVHPLNSGGGFDGPHRGAHFALDGPYFEERRTVDEVERDGLPMRFVSRHWPLERYGRALERAGFVIETLREPTDTDPGSRWYDVPLFVHIVAAKPPVAARADRRVFHIATPADADRLWEAGSLTPESLATEGFVHCSTAAQVVATTQRWFAPEADLVLLELDVERVGSDVSWPEVYPGERFPHLHGPVTAEAVAGVHPWGRADRAQWHQQSGR